MQFLLFFLLLSTPTIVLSTCAPIQRRVPSSSPVNFDRTVSEYEKAFGNPFFGDYWTGMWSIAEQTRSYGDCSLVVGLHTKNGGQGGEDLYHEVKYKLLYVEEEYGSLTLGKFVDDEKGRLIGDGMKLRSQTKFRTVTGCQGAWWFNKDEPYDCEGTNLNAHIDNMKWDTPEMKANNWTITGSAMYICCPLTVPEKMMIGALSWFAFYVAIFLVSVFMIYCPCVCLARCKYFKISKGQIENLSFIDYEKKTAFVSEDVEYKEKIQMIPNFGKIGNLDLSENGLVSVISGPIGGIIEQGRSKTTWQRYNFRGRNGSDGVFYGSRGSHGGDGSDVYVRISTDGSNITMQGTIQGSLPLRNENSYFHIDTSGGRGGDGANGRPGSDGRNAYGVGERGGDGEDGGPGGDGGDGGSAGNIKLTATDAGCLWLYDYTMNGGSGGSGGSGGRGGSGGSGGPGDENRSSGSSGWSGSRGRNGSDGYRGRDGEILYVVEMSDGTAETSRTLFNCSIKSYSITSLDDDGVFEPGEVVRIHSINIANTGGLSSPERTMYLEVYSDGFDGKYTQIIPRIRPGSSILVDLNQNLKIHKKFDHRSVYGKFKATYTIHLNLKVLFRDIHLTKRSLRVEYPIQLRILQYPTQLARHEKTIFQFQVMNISNVKKKDVVIRVTTDQNLEIIKNNNFNHFQRHIPVLEKGSYVTQFFSTYISENAPICSQQRGYYECFFNDERIQIEKTETRVSVRDSIRESDDLLFFTDKHINQDLFYGYTEIFMEMGLNWGALDIERNKGISVNTRTQERNIWTENYPYIDKTLVLSLDSTKTISLFSQDDLFAHFANDKDTGMMLLNSVPKREDIYRGIFSDEPHYTLPKKIKYFNRSILPPNYKKLLKKVNEHYKEIEKKEPSQIFDIMVHYKPQRTMFFLCYGFQYHLGIFEKRVSPIDRTSRIVLSKKVSCEMIASNVTKQGMTPNDIYSFVNTLVMTLPISTKIRLLNEYNSLSCSKWEFFIQGEKVNVGDMIANSLFREILQDYSLIDNDEFKRLNLIKKNLQEMPPTPNSYYEIIVQAFRHVCYAINVNGKKYSKIAKNRMKKLEKHMNEIVLLLGYEPGHLFNNAVVSIINEYRNSCKYLFPLPKTMKKLLNI